MRWKSDNETGGLSQLSCRVAEVVRPGLSTWRRGKLGKLDRRFAIKPATLRISRLSILRSHACRKPANAQESWFLRHFGQVERAGLTTSATRQPSCDGALAFHDPIHLLFKLSMSLSAATRQLGSVAKCQAWIGEWQSVHSFGQLAHQRIISVLQLYINLRQAERFQIAIKTAHG